MTNRYQIFKSNFTYLSKELKNKTLDFTLDNFFTPQLIKYTIVIAAFLIFKKRIEFFFADYIIGFVFDKNFGGHEIDIIFILLGILLLAFISYKVYINFSLSNNQILFYSVLFGLYFYYRYIATDLKWNYVNFTFSSYIAYIDILVLLLTYPIAKFFYFLIVPLTKSNKEQFFIEDIPFGDDKKEKTSETDGFDKTREEFAGELSKIILNQSFIYSFSIGIEGKWGSGKTTFMNSVVRLIKKDKNSIIVNANPWCNHEEKNIIINFFNDLSSSLEKYHSGLSSHIEEYRNSLLNLDDGGTLKIISDVFKSIFDDSPSTIEGQYQKLYSAIEEIEKKIVVVIDDLDRLNADEILQVLKLIRNTANFPNTVFVLAYDKEYIQKTLNKENEFLEKFIQFEFHMPETDKTILGFRFYNLIKDKLKPEEAETLYKEMLRNDEEVTIFSLIHMQFKHYRDVTLLANKFLFEFIPIRDDVYIVDMVNLQILKYKYLQVYILLATQFDEYLTTEHQNIKLNREVYALETVESKKGKKIDKRKSKIIESIESNKDKYTFRDDEIVEIERILITLFPKNLLHLIGDLHDLSILLPRNINKYFKLQLLESDISEKDFKQIFEDNKLFSSYLNNWIENKKEEVVIEKLLYYYKRIEDKVNLFRIIDALFFTARNTKKTSVPFSIIVALNEIISERVIKYTNYKDIFDYMFSNYLNPAKAIPPYFFEAHLIDELLRRPKKFEELINENLKTILFEYYQNNTKDSASLKNLNKYLFHYNYEYYENKEEVREILVNFIKEKGFKDFIENVAINEDIIAGKYKLDEFLIKLFGSYPDFYKFINNSPDESFIGEINEFYTLCEITEFKDHIRYDFKETKINSHEGMRHDGKNIKQIFIQINDNAIIKNFENNRDAKDILALMQYKIYSSGKIIMFENNSTSESMEDFLSGIGRTFKASLPNLSDNFKDVKLNEKVKSKSDVLIYLNNQPLIEIISIQPKIS